MVDFEREHPDHSLSAGALQNILDYSGGYASLNDVPLEKLLRLRNKEFAPDGSAAACIPDHGASIRLALTLRINELQEAMRHAGEIMPPDSEDRERELGLIGEALQGAK